jgi:hypothetical protein
MELAALPGEVVPGPEEQGALDVFLEPSHSDACSPRHPDRSPLAFDLEQQERK